jgi:hypothetical protein
VFFAGDRVKEGVPALEEILEVLLLNGSTEGLFLIRGSCKSGGFRLTLDDSVVSLILAGMESMI